MLRQHWRVVVCLAVGVGMSWGVRGWVIGMEEKAARMRFHRDAENRMSALQREFEVTVTKVQGLQTLFTAKPELTEMEFEYAVSRIRGATKNTWVFEWAPRVERAAKGKLEARMRAAGFPGYTVEAKPPGMGVELETLYPLVYISPSANSARILGLHFGPRKEGDTPTLARDRGVTMVSPPYVLLEDRGKEEQLSVAVYAPVYRFGSNAETVEERRSQLIGYVICAIRIGELVERAVGPLAPAGIDLQLDDLNTKGGPKRMYLHRTRLAGAGMERQAAFHREQAFVMGGREWRVKMEGHLPENLGWSPGVLVAVLPTVLLTGLAAWLLYRRGSAVAVGDAPESAVAGSDEPGKASEGGSGRRFVELGSALQGPLEGLLEATGQLAEEPRQRVEMYAQQIAGMARNLVELDLLDKGQFRAVRGEFSIQERVGEVVRGFAGAAKEKGLKLQVRLGEGLPEALVGDADRVGQLLAICCGTRWSIRSGGECRWRWTGFGARDSGCGWWYPTVDREFPPGKRDAVCHAGGQCGEGTPEERRDGDWAGSCQADGGSAGREDWLQQRGGQGEPVLD